MKNLLILFTAVVLLSSCKSAMIYNYTTVKEIYDLKKGMSMSEVNSSLKVSPYEFYTNFEDGNKVLAYKYRRTYQKVMMGSEVKKLNGQAIRYKDDEDLYVIFEPKNNSMLYYATGLGRKSAKGILAGSNKLNLIKANPLSFDKAGDAPKASILPLKKSKLGLIGKIMKLGK
jgi:hypothetical protein